MKIIEFVSFKNNTHFLLSISVDSIIGFEQIDAKQSLLMLNNNKEYIVLGKPRCLMNRWIYTLEKKNNYLHDYIIRPSILFFNNNLNLIESDPIHLDKEQLNGFIHIFDKSLLKNKAIKEKINYY